MIRNGEAEYIIQEMSMLYELSLSVGTSLDLKKNCEVFLKRLMSRKNLTYSAVWIKENYIDLKSVYKDTATLIYSFPQVYSEYTTILDDDPLFKLTEGNGPLCISSDDPRFSGLVHERMISEGSFLIFPLEDIGVLKLFSKDPQKLLVSEGEVSKYEDLIKKFTVSVRASLLYNQVLEEVKVRREIEKELHNANFQLKSTMEELEKTIGELDNLNNTLEERIAKEVLNSRQKDTLLQQQSKQVAMGELINTIAHQWRQPLNSISLAGSNILLSAELGEDIEETLENARLIIRLAARLSDTITEFMEFYKQKHALEKTSLKSLIAGVTELLQPQIYGANINIFYEFHQEEPIIYTYKAELQQVLINLFSNAIQQFSRKDMEKEKKIHIRTKSVPKGNSILLEIEDNGGGIEEAVIDKIFDPYFTTKKSGQGTGLGLYICKNIVEELLKGQITVQNKDKGVLFTLHLPQEKLSME